MSARHGRGGRSRLARRATGGIGAVVGAAAIAAAGCSGPGSASTPPPGQRPGTSPVAGATVGPGLPAGAGQPTASVPDAGLSPAQLWRAYDVGPLLRKGIDGRGQTVVIVDSFGSPTIKRDLAAYDRAFRLPAPPSLRVIAPVGRVPAFRPSKNRVGWAGETTLDVEAVHAMAPGASILVVETPTSENEGITGFPQIVAAELYVIHHHLGSVISQSFGATEQSFTTPAQLRRERAAYIAAARAGITVLGASGDDGATGQTFDMKTFFPYPTVGWPASDPLVTSVGGTRLFLTRTGARVRPDVAWNHSGGGRSAVFARPAYQSSAAVRRVVLGRRGVPDVSMDAACQSALAGYGSFASAGWFPACGTSLATPLFAGIVALADQEAGHRLGLINPALYRMAAAGLPGIVDVRSGNNSFSFVRHRQRHVVQGFPAGPGYDLISGLGTVNAAYFVPELARMAG